MVWHPSTDFCAAYVLCKPGTWIGNVYLVLCYCYIWLHPCIRQCPQYTWKGQLPHLSTIDLSLVGVALPLFAVVFGEITDTLGALTTDGVIDKVNHGKYPSELAEFLGQCQVAD
jgi:hypothetical protein